jgi:ABC-type glycerol-3-phosphate transport system permease component
MIAIAQREHHQHYPQPGWVEHDPAQIWATTVQAVGQAVAASGITPAEIAAVGITKMIGTGDAQTDWNLIMSTAVLAMLPPVAVILLMQRWFVKGLVETEK